VAFRRVRHFSLLMPERPSHPAAGRSISSIVGQPTAIVGSAEANIGIPKLSRTEYDALMVDFNRIARDAKAELERSANGDDG